MRLVTWSLTDNLLETVTPNILMIDARPMSGNEGSRETDRFLFLSVITISTVLEPLSDRLLALATFQYCLDGVQDCQY